MSKPMIYATSGADEKERLLLYGRKFKNQVLSFQCNISIFNIYIFLVVQMVLLQTNMIVLPFLFQCRNREYEILKTYIV